MILRLLHSNSLVNMMKKWIIIILLCLFICILSIHIPFRTALVFYKENTDKMEAYLPLQEGDTFQIIYTHSIHLSDVVDKYQISSNHDIKQYETVYEQYGIGMPANAVGNEEFVYEDGKYHIKNMERIFPSIHLRNGKTVSKHRLVWGDRKEYLVLFNDYFNPGDYFTVKVDDLSIWNMWKGVKIDDKRK